VIDGTAQGQELVYSVKGEGSFKGNFEATQGTVAQKTVPMFGCFGKIELE